MTTFTSEQKMYDHQILGKIKDGSAERYCAVGQHKKGMKEGKEQQDENKMFVYCFGRFVCRWFTN